MRSVARINQGTATGTEIALALLAAFAFYLASRKSHYRYMTAVAALNGPEA